MIELFSGTKTVSKTFESHGWEAISIDNNPKLKPTICCDILKLDIALLPEKVDFVWASPDCSKFSRSANSKHWHKCISKYRVYDYIPATKEAFTALLLLKKTIHIINLYPDALFIIENPIGRIRHMMDIKNLGHYRYAVNYADFGFPYSKETYLFSNMMLPFSTKKVFSLAPGLQTVNSRLQRSKVPGKLVEEVFKYLP